MGQLRTAKRKLSSTLKGTKVRRKNANAEISRLAQEEEFKKADKSLRQKMANQIRKKFGVRQIFNRKSQ